MLYTTIEFLTLASSNYHFLFCFCNVIIFFLLFGSSKSSVSSSRNYFKRVPAQNVNIVTNSMVKVNNNNNDIIQDNNIYGKSNQEEVKIIISEEVHHGYEHEHQHEVENEEEYQIEFASDEDNDCDVLRKKIEEFIDKVNQEWRAENLIK
ncbi:hypothetical protein vseg_014622 [Gypsophila vaccaria]